MDYIRAILGSELSKHIAFYVAKGKISLASVGRNILVQEGGPVLVVGDSDTTNPKLVAEQRGMIRLALGRFASEGEYDAFLFTPAIEVVWFEAPEALKVRLGRKPAAEAMKIGLISPKAAAVLIPEFANGKPPPPDAEVGELLATGTQAAALRQVVDSLLHQASHA